MIFHFLSEYINIFRYLSFRSMGAVVTSFLLVLCFAPKFIQALQKMKLGQQVREEGPQAHLAKTGTPTMGGIFIWGAVLISALLWCSLNGFVWITCLTVVLFTSIGFIDDYAKIKQKDTKGLSSKGKLILQSVFAFVVMGLVYLMPQYHQKADRYTIEVVDSDKNIIASTNVNIVDDWTYEFHTEEEAYLIERQYNPETGKTVETLLFQIPKLIQSTNQKQTFSSEVIKNDGYEIVSHITMSSDILTLQTVTTNIHHARLFNAFLVPMYTEVVWYWPLLLAFLFFVFIIVGVSNATNLSDGLDGLATGMGIGFYLPFGVFAYLMGNITFSGYLFYPYIAGIGELTVFISAVIGAFAGFLWYNVHPAEVFMGDTGSLPMGAVIAVIAIMLKQELLLIVAGFMFVLETVSVIIQVFWFKRYKTRIFKMAPIHHHFELSGWKENQVVVRFWIMSAFFAVLALASIKIR